MKNFIKKYMWLWEIIGAALVLASSIIIVSTYKTTLALIVGLLFLFLGLFRIVPLVKTTEDKVLKWCYGIETALEIVVGVLLIVSGCLKDGNAFRDFFSNNCGYFIGAILYLRGLTFFFGTNVRHEQYPFSFFIVHIVAITLGTVVLVKGNFNLKVLAWIIFALCIIVVLLLSYNGAVGYKNYRNNFAAERTTKKVKEKKEKEKPALDAPTSEDIEEEGTIKEPESVDKKEINDEPIIIKVPEEDINIDPVDDEKDKDQPTA